MGWTSYRATHYKPNGTVDKKAECDAYFMEGLNRGHFEVLKSVMKGNTYYAAIQDKVRHIENDIYEPIENGTVWAAVFLVSIDNKDYYNFAYKDMDETCGPCCYDCPSSILKLLSPTENEYALQWRQKCIEKQSKPKLSALPIGTHIKFTTWNGEEKRVYKHPAGYQFKRPFWMLEDGSGYINSKHIADNWVVID